jgi:hypothetical protein
MENRLHKIENYIVRVNNIRKDEDLYEISIKLDGESRFRTIGTYSGLVGDFFSLRKTEHIFRKLNAWGINPFILSMLDGLKTITIQNDDTKEVFRTSYEKFKSHAQGYEFKFAGYDKQKFLPIPLWEKSR